MMENVANDPNEQTKIASLDCLGYTCERIYNVSEIVPDVPELSPELVDQMLTTIVGAVQPTKTAKMRFAALTALKNSLFFVQKNMDVREERDFIVKAICECAKANEPPLRALAFESLDILSDEYYEKLSDYMTYIYNLTTEAIQNANEEEEVKIKAIEFWSTVAMVEKNFLDEEAECREMGIPLNREPSPKYIAAALEPLAPILIQQLGNQDEHAEPEDYDVSKVAGECLQNVSMTVGGPVIQIVMPFVQQNIQNQDWRKRDAAINAFTCILEGPSTDEIGQYVLEAVPLLVQLMNDTSSVIVRESAVYCIDRVAALHIAAVTRDNHTLHSILSALLTKLCREEPRVSKMAASSIFNIAHALKPTGKQVDDTNLLSAPMHSLLNELLLAAERPNADEMHLGVTAMSAVSELISAAASDVQQTLVQLLPAIVARFDAAVKMPSDDKEKKDRLLGSLAGVIQTLMQRLTAQDLGGSVDQIVALLLEGLKRRDSTCLEEIFLAMGSLAGVVEEAFSKYLPHFMPFLLQGLRDFGAESLCQVCIGVTVDISTAVTNNLAPFCDDIMKILLECLKDNSVNRDIKPLVISCFGDIAMAIGGAFEPYLQPCVMLLMQASQQQAGDDEDLMEFIESLRVSILEAYSGIITGLEDGQKLGLIAPILQGGVFQYLQFLAGDPNRSDEVLEKSIALLGDIGRTVGGQPPVKNEFRQPYVATLINAGAASSEESCREIAAWAGGVIQQHLSS